MSIQGNEYQAIFLYLRSLNFHFLDTWVIECVNYYKASNPNISLDVLKNEVKQQWLLVNLREIKVPCFPPDVKSKEKLILNGNYAVQVECMVDSSVSCYSQFQKLFKVNIEDIETTKEPKEVKNKSNRCLTFVISDGVQELEAMEYQPIKKIKTNDADLQPGFKMVILGPVECRKGMILLKDENVRICGGNVDSLIITNSLKNILMKKLELDEADYPDSVSPNHMEEEKENLTTEVSAESQQQFQQNNFENECVETLLSQNDDVFLSVPLETEVFAQEAQTQEYLNNAQDFMCEVDQLEDNWSEDIINKNNHLATSKKHVLPEENLEIPNPKRRSLGLELKENGAGSFTFQNSLNIDDEKDMFTDDFDEPTPVLITSSAGRNKKPVQTKLSSFFKNSGSISDTVYRTSYHQKPVYVSNKPFVYFKQIMSIELSKPTVFKFKAVILTLKKKITIERDKFHLKATITDGSCSIDADFCSAVLEDLLGFSPCEMAAMLKAQQKNSAISQRIKQSFSKAQEKLISLNCLMEIKFFTDGKCPVILSLEELTVQHLQALKDRKVV